MGERVETSAIQGLIAGCSMFGLYVLAYSILESRGVGIGPGTPVGMTVIVACVIPVGIGLGSQVVFGLQRSRVESQVGRIMQDARTTYENAVREADDAYREQLHKGRQTLFLAETELKKVDTGLRLIATHRTRQDESAQAAAA
jgi:hypothetical protein